MNVRNNYDLCVYVLYRVTGGELFEDIVAREFYSEADARPVLHLPWTFLVDIVILYLVFRHGVEQ